MSLRGKTSGSPWPREVEGVEVVPAEWLGLASSNQDGEAFMRAFGRIKRGESPPPGAATCCFCGFPCEDDQTIFLVPTEFAVRPDAVRDGWASAHIACSHTMYRGRYDDLRRMVEEGVPHEEMLRRIIGWPDAA